MNKIIKKIILIMGFLIFLAALILLYVVIHEGGHALVVVLCGGKIERVVFDIINSYIISSEVQYTVTTKALMLAAGTVLPLIVFIVVFLFYNNSIDFKTKTGKIIYHTGFLLFAVTFVSPLFMWIFFPKSNSDAYYFIRTTELNPLWISFSAALILCLLILFVSLMGLPAEIVELISIEKKDINKPDNPQEILLKDKSSVIQEQEELQKEDKVQEQQEQEKELLIELQDKQQAQQPGQQNAPQEAIQIERQKKRKPSKFKKAGLILVSFFLIVSLILTSYYFTKDSYEIFSVSVSIPDVNENIYEVDEHYFNLNNNDFNYYMKINLEAVNVITYIEICNLFDGQYYYREINNKINVQFELDRFGYYMITLRFFTNTEEMKKYFKGYRAFSEDELNQFNEILNGNDLSVKYSIVVK